MNCTATTPELIGFNGFPVNFYAERLSGFDVNHLLPELAKFCLTGDDPAELLSHYFGAVESFERMRRTAIAEGSEILEAQLPVVPANHWSGPELARALQKAIGLATATRGEINNLCRHVLNIIVAETQCRLGLR